MKGKFLVLSLAIIALSIAGSATTLSYFTDSDSSVANFTIGQVKIRTITTSIARSESLSDGTSLVHTDNDLIHIGHPIAFDTDQFLTQLGDLMEAAYSNKDDIRERVEGIVSTYHPADI